jgi:FkbM family methyltransferase
MKTRQVRDNFLGALTFPEDDEVMAPRLESDGIWEPNEVAWLRRVVKPGARCLNVGANVGYFTCWMSILAGPEGHVVAVEPNPTLQPLLFNNLSNLAQGTFEILPVAAGSKNGSIELFTNNRNFGDSRVFDPRITDGGGAYTTHGFDKQVKSIFVSLQRLDDYFLNQNFDVILVDTQGYDDEVIEGLRELISRSKPQILVEFVPSWTKDQGRSPIKVLRSYERHGYELVAPDVGLLHKVSPHTILREMKSDKKQKKEGKWFTNLELRPTPASPSWRTVLKSLTPLLHIRNTWRHFLFLKSGFLELQSTNVELQSTNTELFKNRRLAEVFGKPSPFWGEETPQTLFLTLIERLRVSGPFVPMVRIGSANDGGYVIPDLLESLDYAFCAGVADNSDFEYDLADSGISVFMIDFSVEAPARNHKLFQFSRFALAPSTRGTSFISLEDWVNQSKAASSNMLLKMDIEGAEWRVLDETPDRVLARFEVIVVEFHWFECVKDLWAFGLVQSVLNRLLDGFDLVHVHGNNFARNLSMFGLSLPEVTELTFLRKRTGNIPTKPLSWDPGLDRPNDRNAPEIKLDEFWGI